jgi:hypothetical protein
VVKTGDTVRITLVGLNVDDGDRAKFVNVTASECSETVFYSVVGGSNVSFTPQAPGMYKLCYQWRTGSITPFYMFPAVQLASISYDSVTPYGTAPGCVSTLTISGYGFLLLGNATPTSECVFEEMGITSVTSVTDTAMTCPSPSPNASQLGLVGSVYLRADFGAAGMIFAQLTSVFTVFNLNETVISIDSVWPQAAPYNLAPTCALARSLTPRPQTPTSGSTVLTSVLCDVVTAGLR